MHILIKPTLQLMIYTHWLSLRKKIGYYLYLLAIHVIPEGKANIHFYHDLLLSPASSYKRCEACHQISKKEYENLKLQCYIDIDEMTKERLGESLMKCLFDNDLIYISHQEEPDGCITFKAVIYTSRIPIVPELASIIKSFDNPELAGWIPGTRRRKR